MLIGQHWGADSNNEYTVVIKNVTIAPARDPSWVDKPNQRRPDLPRLTITNLDISSLTYDPAAVKVTQTITCNT